MRGISEGSEPKDKPKHDIDIIDALGNQKRDKGSEPGQKKKVTGDDTGKKTTEKDYDGRSEPVTDDEIKRFKSYKVSAGVIVNAAAVGLQVEYRFVPPVGVKFVSIYAFALGHEDNQYFPDMGEYMVGFLLGPSFHVPVKGNRFDPHLYFGVLYTHFHWIHNVSEKEGDIRDLTFGGGIGLNIRLTNYLDIGINIWCDYDYRVKWEDMAASKGDRIALVMPYVSVNFVF